MGNPGLGMIGTAAITSRDELRGLAQREIARRELARREFGFFARYVLASWPSGARHLEALGRYLNEVERFIASGGREGIGRLMVFMPPRHYKSTSVSVLLPAWFLGRHPDKRVIIVSYNAALAAGFSRRARNLILDNGYRAAFGDRSGGTVVTVAEDSRSVENWEIAGRAGGLTAAGIGGGITGRGAHLLVIDDPVRDRAEAESKAVRDGQWEWFTSTAYTRLEVGGAIVLTMTRWHSDDLAGRLLRRMAEEKGADRWTVVSMPAVAEDIGTLRGERSLAEAEADALRDGWLLAADQLGRKAGEPLWPEMYGAEGLKAIRANVGGYEWDALYQQRPRRLEGALIKAYEIVVLDEDKIPKNLQQVRYWDLAVSGRAEADYLAGARVGRGQDGRLYILDIKRLRGPWAEARGAITQAMLDDPAEVVQGIETAGQQAGYFQELQRDVRLQGRSIIGVNPGQVGNKEVRANIWASRIPDGLVHLARGGWVDAFLAEAIAFPRGAHDDQVDAVSGAVQMLGSDRSMTVMEY